MTRNAWVSGFVTGSCFAAVAALANNASVTNVVLQNPAAGAAEIRFDLSWDNSWRDPVNFDACWIFAKYSTDNGDSWSHATLAASGTNPPGFSPGFEGMQLVVPSDRKGAFFQRGAEGSGTVASTNATLVWNYSGDGVSSNAAAKVRVFAIEMVYVPQGSFSLGGVGSIAGEPDRFYRVVASGASSNTYTVASEATIAVSNLLDCLWAAGSISAGVLGNSFPKGYAPFYIQKMATSRRQFCDFLNTLTAVQQDRHTRIEANIKGTLSIKGTANPELGNRAFFGTDYNGNAGTTLGANMSSLNETNDGEWFQIRDTTWTTARAYTDWAALRPATELEWEKALRGPLNAVSNEYPWGSTVLTNNTSWLNRQTRAEVPATPGANFRQDDANIRVGSFARPGATRELAGAGYYGVLDCLNRPGNALVSANTGKAFTGANGDGAINANGYADTPDWPSSNARRGLVYDGTTDTRRLAERRSGDGMPRPARSAP